MKKENKISFWLCKELWIKTQGILNSLQAEKSEFFISELKQKELKPNFSGSEISRDLLAIGSIPMFIIVASRAAIGDHTPYVKEILLAGLFLFIFFIFSISILKIKPQNHLARTIIIYIFTILFYNNKNFTFFASFLLFLVFISVFYLKYSKKSIFTGAIYGLISSALSFYILKIF